MRYSIALLYTLSALLSTLVQAQSNNRVVVIPLGSDSVDENFLPVALGSVIDDDFNGLGMSMIKPDTGTYVFTLSSDIGTTPTVLLTNAAASLSSRSIGYSLSDSIITVYVFDQSGTKIDDGFSIVVYNSVR